MSVSSNAVAQSGGSIDERPEDVWSVIREEAANLALREPLLRPLLGAQILNAEDGAEMLARVLSARVKVGAVDPGDLHLLIHRSLQDDGVALAAAEADLAAVRERDPACSTFLNALLNLKGFQALQIHRVAHHLWNARRREVAQWLGNHASLVLGPDIHPAARVGSAVMLDHGSGIVVGETAVIEDGVSILQNVTLGGTGKDVGDRHPKVRRGVMIGAGAKVLGNIEIGAFSKVAAGSVVLRPVPPHTTVAGVPAIVVRRHPLGDVPAETMEQTL